MLERISTSPTDALRIGYARSKWVAENICLSTAQTKGVSAEVLRLGQLVFDSEHGIWNETESIPLLVQASQRLGVFPDLDEVLSWLPVDLAAQVCTEIMFRPPDVQLQPDQAWNVANNTEMHWREFLLLVNEAGLSVHSVPVKEWLDRLRNFDSDINPRALELLPFWEAKYLGTELSKRRCISALTQTVSSTLSRGIHIQQEDVRRMLDVWRTSGFLAQ